MNGPGNDKLSVRVGLSSSSARCPSSAPPANAACTCTSSPLDSWLFSFEPVESSESPDGSLGLTSATSSAWALSSLLGMSPVPFSFSLAAESSTPDSSAFGTPASMPSLSGVCPSSEGPLESESTDPLSVVESSDSPNTGASISEALSPGKLSVP